MIRNTLGTRSINTNEPDEHGSLALLGRARYTKGLVGELDKYNSLDTFSYIYIKDINFLVDRNFVFNLIFTLARS